MTHHDTSSSPTNPDPLLTVAETSAYLGLSERTVWREINAGKLFETRLGRNVRVRLSDVEAYLSQQRGQR